MKQSASLVAGLFLAVHVSVPLNAQCPQWSQEFHLPGVNGRAFDALSTDLGTGPLLVVGGSFETAGQQLAQNVAAWDGSQWIPLGVGLDGQVSTLMAFDSGSGLQLYAGGIFDGGEALARLDGNQWTMLGLQGEVTDAVVFDDGTGPSLVLSGIMPLGASVRRLVSFDGTSFNELGQGVNGGGAVVRALHVWDDGSGEALYVTGTFSSVGQNPQVPAASIARWNGLTWTALGTGIDTSAGFGQGGYHLQSHDDGSGPALFLTGFFQSVGGVPTFGVARFRNGSWEGLPNVVAPGAMGVHDDGQGAALYMSSQGGVRRWNGSTFQFLSSATLYPSALISHDDGTGGVLVAAMGAGDQGAPNRVAAWDGTSWKALGDGLGDGLGVAGGPNYLESIEFAGERALWTDQTMAVAGEVQEQGTLARWNGEWSSVETGFDSLTVRDYLVFDDGAGPALFAAGLFFVGTTGYAAARFDGLAWQPLGDPVDTFRYGNSLAVFDEGAGPTLFLGRDSNTPEDVLLRWSPSAGFSSVGGGMGATGFAFHKVSDLLAYDDGSGPALYCAGTFDLAGGVPCNNIARWDGNQWTAVGGGMQTDINSPTPIVGALTVYDPGSGPLLLAGGRFDMVDGQPIELLAAWDGQSWAPLGAGLAGKGAFSTVRHVEIHDPGAQGPQLYVSGDFQIPGGASVPGLARFDGSTWHTAGRFQGTPNALASFDDGGGRALFVAGSFHAVDSIPSHNLARLADPCGPDLGQPFCSSGMNSTGEAALLRASGSAEVSQGDITLQASSLPPYTTALFITSFAAGDQPFGEGRLCVSSPIERILPPAAADSQGSLSLAVDFQAPYAAGFLPGSSAYFQTWYRDPSGGSSAFDLTDGLRIDFR